jgi:hypothetical protein
MAKINIKKKCRVYGYDCDVRCRIPFAYLLCNDFDSQIPEALPVDTPSSTVQTKLPSDLATLTVGKGKCF